MFVALLGLAGGGLRASTVFGVVMFGSWLARFVSCKGLIVGGVVMELTGLTGIVEVVGNGVVVVVGGEMEVAAVVEVVVGGVAMVGLVVVDVVG